MVVLLEGLGVAHTDVNRDHVTHWKDLGMELEALSQCEVTAFLGTAWHGALCDQDPWGLAVDMSVEIPVPSRIWTGR